MAYFSFVLLILLPKTSSKSLYVRPDSRREVELPDISSYGFSFSETALKNEFHELNLEEAKFQYSPSPNLATGLPIKLPTVLKEMSSFKKSSKEDILFKKLRQNKVHNSNQLQDKLFKTPNLQNNHKSQVTISKPANDVNTDNLWSFQHGSNDAIKFQEYSYPDENLDNRNHHLSALSDGFESFQHRWNLERHSIETQYIDSDKFKSQPGLDFEDGQQSEFAFDSQEYLSDSQSEFKVGVSQSPPSHVKSRKSTLRTNLNNVRMNSNGSASFIQAQDSNLFNESNSLSMKSFKNRWMIYKSNRTNAYSYPKHDQTEVSSQDKKFWSPGREHNFTCSLQKRDEISCIFLGSDTKFASSKSILFDTLKRSMQPSQISLKDVSKIEELLEDFHSIQCFFPSHLCSLYGDKNSGRSYAEVVLNQPWMLKDFLIGLKS